MINIYFGNNIRHHFSYQMIFVFGCRIRGNISTYQNDKEFQFVITVIPYSHSGLLLCRRLPLFTSEKDKDSSYCLSSNAPVLLWTTPFQESHSFNLKSCLLSPFSWILLKMMRLTPLLCKDSSLSQLPLNKTKTPLTVAPLLWTPPFSRVPTTTTSTVILSSNLGLALRVTLRTSVNEKCYDMLTCVKVGHIYKLHEA